MTDAQPTAVLPYDPQRASSRRRRLLVGSILVRLVVAAVIILAVYRELWALLLVALVLVIVAEGMRLTRKGIGNRAGIPCMTVDATGVSINSTGILKEELVVPWEAIETVVVMDFESTLPPRWDLEEPELTGMLPDGGLFYSARSIHLVPRDDAVLAKADALSPRRHLGVPGGKPSISVNTTGSMTGEVFHAFLLALAAEAASRQIIVQGARPRPAARGPKPRKDAGPIVGLADVRFPPDTRRLWPLVVFLGALVAIVGYIVWAAFLLGWYLLLLLALPFALVAIAASRGLVSRFRYVPWPAVAFGPAGITTPQITVPWEAIESIVVLLHPTSSRDKGKTGLSIADTLPTGLLVYGAQSIALVIRDPDGFKQRAGRRLGLLVRGGLFGVAAGKQAVPCAIATSEIGQQFYDFIKAFDAECAKRGIPVVAY